MAKTPSIALAALDKMNAQKRSTDKTPSINPSKEPSFTPLVLDKTGGMAGCFMKLGWTNPRRSLRTRWTKSVPQSEAPPIWTNRRTLLPSRGTKWAKGTSGEERAKRHNLSTAITAALVQTVEHCRACRTSFWPSRVTFRPNRLTFWPMPSITTEIRVQSPDDVGIIRFETFLSKTTRKTGKTIKTPTAFNLSGSRMRSRDYPCLSSVVISSMSICSTTEDRYHR